jgi:hypothetical protein
MNNKIKDIVLRVRLNSSDLISVIYNKIEDKSIHNIDLSIEDKINLALLDTDLISLYKLSNSIDTCREIDKVRTMIRILIFKVDNHGSIYKTLNLTVKNIVVDKDYLDRFLFILQYLNNVLLEETEKNI